MKIKICGITNIEDAKVASENGVNFLGFINYKKSPRFIEIEKAFEIIKTLKKEFFNKNIKFVGVFVNKKLSDIFEILEFEKKENSIKSFFDIFQLHGDESLEYIRNLKIKLKELNLDIKIWKAFRIKSLEDFYGQRIFEYAEELDGILLDTFQKDNYGGTGESFDWQIFEDLKKIEGSEKLFNKIILSGGIGLENIDEALKKNDFVFAVDINSKIEDYPGKKNREKMSEILKRRKNFNDIKRNDF
jgi:phosphoribosylanthranilate isomerase